MISLLATVTFMFSSCDNDDSSDTTKPLIELHEPEEGQALEIGNEHGVHFEMDLSDEDVYKRQAEWKSGLYERSQLYSFG